MIKRLSHNIASYLSNELEYDNERKEVLSYGLQIILGTSFKILSILTVSYFLGIFITTLISLVSFVVFRMIIGGTHYDTYNKCFLASAISIIILGTIGQRIPLNTFYILVMAGLVYIKSLVFTVIWVPAGTEKKMIKNKELRLKMKMKAIVLSTTWLVFVLLIHDYVLSHYIFSSILGVFLAFLFVTPIAYRFTELRILKKNSKKEG